MHRKDSERLNKTVHVPRNFQLHSYLPIRRRRVYTRNAGQGRYVWVCGSSDKIASFPKDNPVAPEDLLATIYDALGIDLTREIYDRENRPHRACDGTPVAGMFG
jgi:hypothetical protein